MLPRVNLIRSAAGEYLAFGHDFISQNLFSKGQWEEGVVAVTSVFLAGIDKPLVIDVGANMGAYTVPVAKSLQQVGGEVISMEAQRIIYYQLCGNVFLNQLDNVKALHLAVGHEAGALQLPRPNYSLMGNVGGFSIDQKLRERNGTQAAMTDVMESVPMLPLDDLEVPRAPSFIKIDVEGFELNVLKGAQKFLARHTYPPFFFEAWSEDWFADEKKELLKFVGDLGYKITPLMGYDHIAQHPANAVEIIFERNATGFNLARVR
jgi:FkbM family methyltransferase